MKWLAIHGNTSWMEVITPVLCHVVIQYAAIFAALNDSEVLGDGQLYFFSTNARLL